MHPLPCHRPRARHLKSSASPFSFCFDFALFLWQPQKERKTARGFKRQNPMRGKKALSDKAEDSHVSPISFQDKQEVGQTACCNARTHLKTKSPPFAWDNTTSVSATLAQTADEDAATFVSPVFSQAKEVLGTAARHDHLSSTLPPFAWDDNTACSILRTATTSSSTSATATRTHSADQDTAAFVSPVSSRDREALGPAARHDHLGMTAPPFSWEEAPCATGAP